MYMHSDALGSICETWDQWTGYVEGMS